VKAIIPDLQPYDFVIISWFVSPGIPGNKFFSMFVHDQSKSPRDALQLSFNAKRSKGLKSDTLEASLFLLEIPKTIFNGTLPHSRNYRSFPSPTGLSPLFFIMNPLARKKLKIQNHLSKTNLAATPSQIIIMIAP